MYYQELSLEYILMKNQVKKYYIEKIKDSAGARPFNKLELMASLFAIVLYVRSDKYRGNPTSML